MSTRCTAEQFAEAVILWSVEVGGSPVFCKEREDLDELKPLDRLISMIEVFRDGFDTYFFKAFDEHTQQLQFSKQKFIDFLEPRCLLLSRNNGCFDLTLTCAFVSSAVLRLRFENDCFHLSRVAFKLLTAVLVDKFSEMFTETGWESLMVYCRMVHDTTYPSKKNRPPDYYFFKNSRGNEDLEQGTNFKEFDSNEDTRENKLLQETDYEVKETKFHGKPFSCAMEIQKGIDIPVAAKVSATNTPVVGESSATDAPVAEDASATDTPVAEDASATDTPEDEATYWHSFNRGQKLTELIWERISSEKYLNELFDLLESPQFAQNMDPENISSNKYDIDISDDEDIENLEKTVKDPDEPDPQITFSDHVVDFLTEEVREKKNKELDNSLLSEVRLEDITDEDRFLHFVEILCQSDDEPKCELCNGRAVAFKRNWLESFDEKYLNIDLVTDFLDIRPE